MSEDMLNSGTSANGNADGTVGGLGSDLQPVFNIITQYTKDLSFENIIPAHKIESDNHPEVEAQVKVEAEQSPDQEDVYTVSLIINIHAKADNKSVFILDLDYKGDFVIRDFPKELMGPMLYVECPRQLFPFVRNIVASAVAEGGFPPMYLAPADFVKLYQEQMEAKGQTIH